MKHGSGVFNKEASLKYTTLNAEEKSRLALIGETSSTMAPREINNKGRRCFSRIQKIVSKSLSGSNSTSGVRIFS